MSRLLTLMVMGVAVSTAACAIPTYEPEPVSAAQWQRRQEAIERQQAERERLCRITKDEDPRKEELCRGVEREND
ncbi:hypothetical protein [Brevundimonas sp.]|uniref:hypothetical protein n=1 Tax=Brevundimonas sp. TaxID=1871086 RepID=UPI002ED9E672